MKDVLMRSLEEGEEKALFDFAVDLPEKGLWGKKTRLLRKGYREFLRFFAYVRAFQYECSLVAEENGKIVGFAIAVYNPRWVRELTKRYRCRVEKRAHILGIAFIEGRKNILNALVMRLAACFSKEGIESLEYPTLGSVCLTTATDVLTPENVDAVMMFREVGFRISECYYSMKLDLESYTRGSQNQKEGTHFHFGQRLAQIVRENEVLGKIIWDPVENGKTSIGIFVKQAHRGKGFGTALMAETLHHLKSNGVKSVELGVDGNNLPALKLYREFGFDVQSTNFYVMMPCCNIACQRTQTSTKKRAR